jgi:holliday junction DNA helicase RuvA
MFGHITGKIFDLKGVKAVVDAHGIGFVVHSTPSYLSKLRTNQEASFWIHTAVRENSIDLYGFETEEELRVFELLITVSGVGPKSGLAILGVAGVRAIEEAVATNDTSSLTKISGIGKKTAEKIVLELSGKLVATTKGEKNRNSEDIDVFEALKSLGYRERDIQETIKKLPKDLVGANEKIKYALKNLGK